MVHFHSMISIRQISPFSAKTVFIRQILTYKDGPHAEKIKYFLWPLTHNIGIQMNQKE